MRCRLSRRSREKKPPPLVMTTSSAVRSGSTGITAKNETVEVKKTAYVHRANTLCRRPYIIE